MGTKDGSISMWKCPNNPDLAAQVYGAYSQSMYAGYTISGLAPQVPPPVTWSLSRRFGQGSSVSCLAATDEVVVSGSDDGAVRILRMATPFEESVN